jgi:hypothetical protein
MPSPPPESLSRPEALGDPRLLARASEFQLKMLWAQTQVDLRAAHQETAILTAQLHRARVTAWNRSPGTSVAAREKDADADTVDLNSALIEARCMLACLELERELYAFFLGG